MAYVLPIILTSDM